MSFRSNGRDGAPRRPQRPLGRVARPARPRARGTRAPTFVFFVFFVAKLLASAHVVVDGSAEIVVAANAPSATRLAAEELNFFLKGVLGAPLPVVERRTAGKTAIVLGAGGGSPGRLAPPCGHAGRVPLPVQSPPAFVFCLLSFVLTITRKLAGWFLTQRRRVAKCAEVF